MFKGLALVLSACFIWGLIFVLPTFLQDFSPIEIALGRYFFYGIISLIFFIFFCRRNLIQYPLHIWLKAMCFALIANILYYTAIVLAVNYSSPGMATLITGIAPISIAFYGNWLKNECSFAKLVIPALLIFVGLFTVNLDFFLGSTVTEYSAIYVFGMFCAFLSLICWTWFVVANTDFLKTCPKISYFEWSTMIGVATFAWVLIAVIALNLFDKEFQVQKFFLFNSESKRFLLITGILGCVCSWCGSFLWNSGCTRLPISLSGQMTIFEPIFGLVFVYVVENRFPAGFETSGILLMLVAIVYSVSLFNRRNLEPVEM